jgi:hypothetical protein
MAGDGIELEAGSGAIGTYTDELCDVRVRYDVEVGSDGLRNPDPRPLNLEDARLPRFAHPERLGLGKSKSPQKSHGMGVETGFMQSGGLTLEKTGQGDRERCHWGHSILGQKATKRIVSLSATNLIKT